MPVGDLTSLRVLEAAPVEEGQRGGSGMISNFPRPLPALPPRPGPGSEWLWRGRPRAGAERMRSPGYKGTRHRPLPTVYRCPVRPARIPSSSCPDCPVAAARVDAPNHS